MKYFYFISHIIPSNIQKNLQMNSWEKQLTPLKDLYEIIVVVGEGAYGEVYKARNILTRDLVAMKKIKRQFGDGFPYSSIREIALLKSVQHPNIVRLIDVITDRNLDVYLIFDYAEYDLDYILKTAPLSEKQIKSYMRQLLFGLYVLHQRNIFHRDLKPQNILVKASNVIEIADIGLAKQISPKRRKKTMTSTVITIYYRPLELFFKAPVYGPEVDIWSLGCIFYEMIKRRPLFYTPMVRKENTESVNEACVVQQIFTICGYPTEEDWPGWTSLSESTELFKSIKVQPTGNLDSFLTSELPTEYIKVKPLLLSMLQLNPKKRLPIEDLLTNEYLHNINNCLDPSQLARLSILEKYESKRQQQQQQQQALRNQQRNDDIAPRKVYYRH